MKIQLCDDVATKFSLMQDHDTDIDAVAASNPLSMVHSEQAAAAFESLCERLGRDEEHKKCSQIASLLFGRKIDEDQFLDCSQSLCTLMHRFIGRPPVVRVILTALQCAVWRFREHYGGILGSRPKDVEYPTQVQLDGFVILHELVVIHTLIRLLADEAMGAESRIDICGWINQRLLERPSLITLLFLQDFPIDAIRFMVEYVPAVHIVKQHVLEWHRNLSAEQSPQRHRFLLELAACLALKYPLPLTMQMAEYFLAAILRSDSLDEHSIAASCRFIMAFPPIAAEFADKIKTLAEAYPDLKRALESAQTSLGRWINRPVPSCLT